MVKLNAAGAVGVPDSTPALLNDRPIVAGSSPL
jgi:hypothetical protein